MNDLIHNDLIHKAYFKGLTGAKRLSKAGFYTFDVETKDGLINKKPFCWSLAYSQGGKNPKIKVLQGNGSKFISLFKFFKKKKHKTRYSKIYTHNAWFDVKHIMNYCDINEIDFFTIKSGSNVVCLIIKEYKMKFIDSVQFLKAKQSKAEISWEVPEILTKIDCQDLFDEKHPKFKPFKKWTKSDKERLKHHNKNDVLALYDILVKFRKAIYELVGVDFISCITIAGLSLKSFRTDIKNNSFIPYHEIYNPNNGIIETKRSIVNPCLTVQQIEKGKYSYLVRQLEYFYISDSFFGGRCEVFNTNLLKDMSYMDRNSMYPFEMSENYYPIGMPYWSKDINRIWGIIKKKNKENTKLAIIDVIITPNKENNYPLLPKRTDQRVLFTNDTRRWKYTSVELHEAWKNGAKIKPIGALIWPGKSKIFKSYMSKLFEYRKQFDKEIDEGKKKSIKYLMNTLWGKFAQRMIQTNRDYKMFKNKYECEEWSQSKMIELEANRTDLEKKYEIIPYMRSKMRPETEGGWRLEWDSRLEKGETEHLMQIAVFTTAYARINLTKEMKMLHKQKIPIGYCDSDSIVIPTKFEDKLNVGKEFGQWKAEKRFKRLKFLAPKAYYGLDNENKLFCKMKGLNRNILKDLIAKCKNIEELETELRKEIPIAEKGMKFSESMAYGEFLVSKKSSRHFDFKNQKRNFDKETGLSTPYNDETIPDKFKIPECALGREALPRKILKEIKEIINIKEKEEKEKEEKEKKKNDFLGIDFTLYNSKLTVKETSDNFK